MDLFKKTFVVILLLVGLTACGGEGGDNASSAPPAATPPSSPDIPELVMPAGVWEGKIIALDNNEYDLLGLVAPSGNGRFIIQDDQNEILSIISIDITLTDEENYTGTFEEFYDGLNEGTITGTYSDGHIDGINLNSDGQTSTHNLYKSVHSNLGASFDQTSGTYLSGINNEFLDIDSEGKFTIAKANNCVVSGTLTIPDPAINIYEIDFRMTCPNSAIVSGTGLGSLLPYNNLDAFVFELRTNSGSVVDTFYKQ